MQYTDPEKLYIRVMDASGNGLLHEEDLRLIINAAATEDIELLFKIGFNAKFLLRTRNIMRRISPRDDAGEKLKQTFLDELEATKALVMNVLKTANAETRRTFEKKYFTPTLDSFASLMELLQDLSWIQNIRLDDKLDDREDEKERNAEQ